MGRTPGATILVWELRRRARLLRYLDFLPSGTEVLFMQFEIAQSVVPGHYAAEFVGVESVTNEYGQGLRWRFKIVGGTSSGEIKNRSSLTLLGDIRPDGRDQFATPSRIGATLCHVFFSTHGTCQVERELVLELGKDPVERG